MAAIREKYKVKPYAVQEETIRMTRKEWRVIAACAQRLKMQGRQVDAIKYLRSKTKCGIKEAYDAVNKLGGLSLIEVRP